MLPSARVGRLGGMASMLDRIYGDVATPCFSRAASGAPYKLGYRQSLKPCGARPSSRAAPAQHRTHTSRCNGKSMVVCKSIGVDRVTYPSSGSGQAHLVGRTCKASALVKSIKSVARRPRMTIKAASGAYGVMRKKAARGACDGKAKPVTSSVAASNAHHIVGCAQEGDYAHAHRHPLKDRDKWAKVCGRCAFLKFRSQNNIPKWLAPKPKFLSGTWGLGCLWCAAAQHSPVVQARRRQHMTQNRMDGRCSQAISRAGKWSRYEQHNLLTCREFGALARQHECSDLHRLSESLFFNGIPGVACDKDPRVGDSFRTAHRADDDVAKPSIPNASNSIGKAKPCADKCLQSSADLSTGPPVATSQFASNTGTVYDSFRGGVPPIQDWLDLWAESISCISQNKQYNLKKLKRLNVRSKRNARKMLAVLAEVTRDDIRARFRDAYSISLAVDESDGRKIVRARCDTPGPPYHFNCVVGVLTKSWGLLDTAVKEVQEDHAKKTHKSLDQFHRLFFTRNVALTRHLPKKRRAAGATDPSPRGVGPPVATHTPVSSKPLGTRVLKEGPPVATKTAGRRKLRQCRNVPEPMLDEDDLSSYRHKVRVLASDGGAAERRALFFSASGEYFPHANCLIKDMAHSIRIATQKPMKMVDAFQQVYEEIINNRHALLPDLKNSNKWKLILEALQREVIQMPALRFKECLDVVFRHLAFAKQRMDSCAEPLAKLCLMLLPVALLLASLSSDARLLKAERDRTAALLSKMQPRFMIALGVSADWGLICLEFLRKFDCSFHDIANSWREMENFIETIEAVFVNGGIFRQVPNSSASGDVAHSAVFMTERVRQQIKCRCVFRCGEKQTVVWGPIGEPGLQEVLLNARVAARTMNDRVRAIFAGVRHDFQCFDLHRVSATMASQAASGASKIGNLLGCVKSLGRVFRLDRRVLALEYNEVLPVVHNAWSDARAKSGPNEIHSVSNASIWQKLLDVTFTSEQFPERPSAFTELLLLIRIWFSILDGETLVERDFAHVRAFVRESRIHSQYLLDDLVVLKLSGPVDASALAYQIASGEFIARDFLIRCANKWRTFYGIRYGTTPFQRKVRPRLSKKPSFRQVKASVQRAARSVVEAARDRHSQDVPEMTAYGVRADTLRAPRFEKSSATSIWNKQLQRFSQDSQKYLKANEHGRLGRFGFAKPKSKCGYVKDGPFPLTHRVAFVPTCDPAACGAANTPDLTALGHRNLVGNHKCEHAQVVVIDSLERLHGTCPPSEWVSALVASAPIILRACLWKRSILTVVWLFVCTCSSSRLIV